MSRLPPQARLVVNVFIEDPAKHHLRRHVCDALRHGRWKEVVAFQQVPVATRANIIVRLCDEAWLNTNIVERLHRPDLAGMSVTRFQGLVRTPSVVMLNKSRWVHGPDPGVPVRPPPTASAHAVRRSNKLRWYRMYLVNHELGHALGLGHPEPLHPHAARVPSVMAQQTREPEQPSQVVPTKQDLHNLRGTLHIMGLV